MAYSILHDTDKRIAVYFCTTSDLPVEGVAFTGIAADVQAEDFSDYLAYHYGQGDPRAYETQRLQEFCAEWREQAFAADEVFTPTMESEADGSIHPFGVKAGA